MKLLSKTVACSIAKILNIRNQILITLKRMIQLPISPIYSSQYERHAPPGSKQEV